ncbi:TIGR04282 family arsenosugar biosynthesis glycosyltransferase [soil metagenome]
MTKAPRAGQVKTRLIPLLTPEEAAALNVCFLRDLSAAIADAGWPGQGVACYTPVGAEEIYASILPSKFLLMAQRDGPFGQRLAGALEDLLAAGFGSVCLINSDSPTVPAANFAQAALWLAEAEDTLVLGPSDDGGYYLIGMKRLHRRIFEEIDWSTDRVLKQTLARAAEIGLAVQLLPLGYDVDESATLHRLCQDLFGPNEMENANTAPATRAFLRSIIAREGRARIWPNDEAALSIG